MLFCIIWITSYQFCWKKLTELLPTTTLHRILYIPLTRMFLLNSSCGIQTRICVVSSNFKKLGSEITERSLLHEVCSSNTPWQSQSWKTLASSLTAARRNQTRLSFVNQTSTFALIMILLRVFDPWRGKWRLRNRPTFQCKWWVLNTKHRLISKWWSRQWYEGQSAIAIVLKTVWIRRRLKFFDAWLQRTLHVSITPPTSAVSVQNLSTWHVSRIQDVSLSCYPLSGKCHGLVTKTTSANKTSTDVYSFVPPGDLLATMPGSANALYWGDLKLHCTCIISVQI